MIRRRLLYAACRRQRDAAAQSYTRRAACRCVRRAVLATRLPLPRSPPPLRFMMPPLIAAILRRRQIAFDVFRQRLFTPCFRGSATLAPPLIVAAAIRCAF